jgi:hypothetical protein
LTGDTELKVDNSGKSQNSVRLSNSGPGKPMLEIPAGTTMKEKDGSPLASITMNPPATMPAAPPQGKVMVAQDFGPDGATFDPPITLTLTFDPASLPASARKNDLVIAFWDGSKWIMLETKVDAATNTLSAKISHFTIFGILAKQPAVLQPPLAAITPPSTIPVTPPAAPVTPLPTAPAPVTPPTETPSAPTAPAAPVLPAGPNWLLVSGLVIAALVVIIATVLVMRRKVS